MLTIGIKNSVANITSISGSNILLRLILISLLIFWIFGFIYPFFISKNILLVNYFLERIYSRVCHQEISKCLLIDNESMLVCARCTGIYFGGLITGLFILFKNVPQLRIKTLLITSLPILLDVLFTTIGIYTYSKTLALITGLIFGSVIYIFLLNELENIFSTKSINRNE